jgi:predicted transcriptional regulator
MTEHVEWQQPVTGEELLKALSALANPHRLRIVAELSRGRNYVSQLAREIQMSRPLLHMHLQKLEGAGFIAGRLELSEEGKAMKYYELTPFALTLDAATIARLAESLPDSDAKGE